MKKRDEKTGKFVRTKPDYRAMYELLKQNYDLLSQEYDEVVVNSEQLEKTCIDKECRIEFLLSHCPFWVRWMYNKQFGK